MGLLPLILICNREGKIKAGTALNSVGHHCKFEGKRHPARYLKKINGFGDNKKAYKLVSKNCRRDLILFKKEINKVKED
jgi:hypothetical protein